VYFVTKVVGVFVRFSCAASVPQLHTDGLLEVPSQLPTATQQCPLIGAYMGTHEFPRMARLSCLPVRGNVLNETTVPYRGSLRYCRLSCLHLDCPLVGARMGSHEKIPTGTLRCTRLSCLPVHAVMSVSGAYQVPGYCGS
jgi:hypothetical protein